MHIRHFIQSLYFKEFFWKFYQNHYIVTKYIKKFEKLFTKNSTFAIIKLSSINKGELYMEYGKTNENATYLKACENVKKIANAIKTIKMKYLIYMFNQI